MKKLYLFSLIAFSLVSINAFAQDEDLHDAAVLSKDSTKKIKISF